MTYGFRPRPHVWGMYSWHRNRDVGFRDHWVAPALREARRRADNRARWKAMGRRIWSVGDRARMVTTAAIAGSKSFRLVDAHGRVYGPRYTGTRDYAVREWASATIAAIDSRGEMHFIDNYTRVRIVARQQEDLHSQLSRMMRAAHRRAE